MLPGCAVHRGPDASALGSRGSLGLAQGRLAVSARAQPAATMAWFSSVPLASQTAKATAEAVPTGDRHATGASRIQAASALAADGGAILPVPQVVPRGGGFTPDRRTTRSLSVSVPPSTTATWAAGAMSSAVAGSLWRGPAAR